MRALNAHVCRVLEERYDCELLGVPSKIWIGFLELPIEILSKSKLVIVLVLHLSELACLVRIKLFVFESGI